MRVVRAALAALVLVCIPVAFAVQSPHNHSHGTEPSVRFADKIKAAPWAVISIETLEPDTLAGNDPRRQAWDAFRSEHEGRWRVHLDSRSALPTLALGSISWVPAGGLGADGQPTTMAELETLARTLIERHPTILGRWQGQLVLDNEASSMLPGKPWLVVFRQEVDGVPVVGARMDFQVKQGNLVAFGAQRLAPALLSGEPSLNIAEGWQSVVEYLGLEANPGRDMLDPGTLQIVPIDPSGPGDQTWTGSFGMGLDHRLIWRYSFRDPGEEATWVAEIDAQDGSVLAFYDDTRYEAVRGGVYPISEDGDCANDGCEIGGYPMPFVDISEDGAADIYTGDSGVYECATLGSEIRTNLDGQYYRISDTCGAVSEAATCDDELDMGITPGDNQNCTVNPGDSAGNTEASRSMYYNVNRVGQKARHYLPTNNWLHNTVVTCRSNVNSTCNASWSGTLNMYRAGNGCGNTSTINGVVTHEWGHGMDQNDGGGYDNSSEAYADVVAIFETRESCVGRGFYVDGRTCSGYGDTCLTCTGIRDHDWSARTENTPATPANFTSPRCGGGSGPCGKAVHCESYVISESIFDFATRDLPAAGYDEATSWQIAEHLWYSSRDGSGGNIINCSLPNADSCGTGSWYHRMRLADDDDGNLANGTPHAAELFAAFNRHEIACGSAGDPENQSTSSCPALAKPVVTTKSLTNAVELTWDPVPDAQSYLIHRADIDCDRGHTPIAVVDATLTTYLDDELINDFPVNYRVQAFGANEACFSAVSDCMNAAPQPFAGKVRFDAATYGCSNLITLQVTDANVGQPTVSVQVWSDTEPTPETLVLNETAPESGKYIATIETTSGSAVNGDGFLSTTNGDTLSAEYIDADDGAGGFNQVRQDSALSDCVFPIISNVDESGISGSQATINWDTDEISDTLVRWGETKPPTTEDTGASRVTDHSVTLTGLQECTVYWYEVQSTDPAGNLALDSNAGQFFYFETLGDFGDGLQPCHAGQVAIDLNTYSCADSLSFRVTDLDLNLDAEAIDTYTLLATSSTETEAEVVVVTETDVNSSKFTGSIPTALGAAIGADGVLQLSDDDVITVTYQDTDDGTGAPAINFDTAIADCGGPVISDLRVDTITDQRGTIRWTTAEPADTVVEWGTTPSLGNTFTNTSRTTGHNVTLNQFADCGDVYFRISSTDEFGNTRTLDADGTPFSFNLGTVPGLYYRATFESGASGWTLEGEWESGAPQGLGGDPSDAYNNTAVLGVDLSGQGANAGQYEANIFEKAITPTFDASSWTNTKLMFYRRLRVHSSDEADIYAFAGPGYPVFRSDGSTINESSFSFQEIDLSAIFDLKPAAFLEFRQRSDAATHYGGWTIDDVILKDGTQPDYGQCLDCGGAPSFSGATSAIDNDACGASGVTVSWDGAVSWGSGADGTYNVYRGLTPDFVPGAGNLVAAGVDALSFDDASAPTDQPVYYVVRAESDETCSSGPANGGGEDANVVRVLVDETTSRPTPGEVPGLMVDLVGFAHVRLSWDAASGATGYTVYRGNGPLPEDFTQLGSVEGDRVYEDLDEGSLAQTRFYLVTGSNPCGDEGP